MNDVEQLCAPVAVVVIVAVLLVVGGGRGRAWRRSRPALVLFLVGYSVANTAAFRSSANCEVAPTSTTTAASGRATHGWPPPWRVVAVARRDPTARRIRRLAHRVHRRDRRQIRLACPRSRRQHRHLTLLLHTRQRADIPRNDDQSSRRPRGDGPPSQPETPPSACSPKSPSAN